MGQTTAGTTFGVSLSLPATQDKAGYEALTYNLVGEITNIDEYGRVYTLVTSNPLAERRTQKYKGSYDEGSFTITFNKVDGDVGQDDMRTSNGQDANAAIEITHQDGSKDYFEVKVMSFTKAVGDADSMFEGSAQLEIDSDIVEVAAA